LAYGQDNQVVGITGDGLTKLGIVGGSASVTGFSVQIGAFAGMTGQGTGSIAIGMNAAQFYQNTGAIAMGINAGQVFQGTGAIAIGMNAGQTGQGQNSIAIGNFAGPTGMTSNSIGLNASGKELAATGVTGGFYVAPIASYANSTGPFNLLAYGPDNQIVTVTGTTGINISLSTPTVTYDSWLLANIINAPPGVIFNTPINDTNNIYITFNYPIQMMWGLMTSYVPLLMGFNINLYTGLDSYISQSGGSVISNQSSNFIKSTPTDTSIVTCIHVTNTLSISTGYKSSGTYGPEFVIYVPSISTSGLTTSSTGKLWGWYNNNNTNNNINSVLISYLQSVASAIITSLSSTVGTVLNTYSIAVSFTSPTTSGVTSPNLSYTITFTPYSNTIRSGGLNLAPTLVLSNIVSSTSLSSPVSYTKTTYAASNQTTDLFPDTAYDISVTATNFSGLTSNAVSRITTPTIGYSPLNYFIQSGNIPTLDITLPTFYNAKLVLDNSTIRSIISANSISGTIILPVQNSYSNRGTTGNGATSNLLLNGLNAVLSGGSIASPQTSTPSISLGGWSQANSSNGTANANITLSASTNNDAFPNSANSGYYQTCTLSVNIPYTTTNFPAIPTTSSPYVVTVNGTYPASNTPGGSLYSISPTNNTIYWDGQLSNPTIGSVSFNITSQTTNICGIPVYSGNLSVTITTTAVKNVGYYYFNNTNLLTYSSSLNGYIPPETIISNVTSGISGGLINNSSGLTITTSTSILYIPPLNNATIQNMTVSSIAYNIAGIQSTVATSTPTGIVYDPNSLTAITSIQNITTQAAVGCRVWSGTTVGQELSTATLATLSNGSNSLSTVTFNNDINIISNTDYRYESLFANNLYTNSSTYVIDYTPYGGPNYSTLNSTGLSISSYTGTSSTYRYVTFAWKVNTSGLSKEGNVNIQFIINGISTNNPSVNERGSFVLDSIVLPLFYRVEDATSQTTITNFVGQISTPWINGNLFDSGKTITSSNFSSTIQNYSGLASNTSVVFSNNNATFNVIIGNSLNKDTSSSSVYIYCRIAIPTAISFSFQNITCNLN
jgi:hypothetical protein